MVTVPVADVVSADDGRLHLATGMWEQSQELGMDATFFSRPEEKKLNAKAPEKV